MQCPNCGRNNKNDAKFCPDCGAPLFVPTYDPSPYPAEPPKPKQKSRTRIYVLLIVLLVVLIGAAGFLLYYFMGKNNAQNGTPPTLPSPTITAAAGSSAQNGGQSAATQPATEKTPTVPNIVGMKSADAYNTLTNAGFKFKAEFAYSDSAPEDYIIAQSPKEDTAAQPGSTVTLTISKGTKPADPPKTETPQQSNTPTPARTYTDTTDRYGLNASSRYLSQSDISWMNLEEVQFAINEIYAKNGFRFTKAGDAKTYFESMDWYNPDTTNMNTIVSRMNKYEYANVKLMGQYRDALK